MISSGKAIISQHMGVVFLCLTILITSIGMGAIAPILPLFTESTFHVNRTQVGLAVGLFGIGRIFTSLPAGYLTQRYGRRFVLNLGQVINFVGATMMAISFSYTWLIISRFISGLGWSVYLTGSSVYLRDVAEPQNRAKFLSLLEMSILAGQSIGPLIGGYIGDKLGLRFPLYLSAFVILVALMILKFFVPESQTSKPYIENSVSVQANLNPYAKSGSFNGRLWKLLISPGLIFVGMFSLMIVANRQGGRFSVLPLYGESKGFNAAQIGVFISVTHVPQFFTTMASGFLSDRFGRKFTIIPGVALIVLGLLVFHFTGNLPQMMISGILMGLGEGLAGPPGLAFFADIAPPGMEGITMGLYRTFGGIGSAVGAVLLGGIADIAGFAWSIGIDAILLSCTALGVMLFVRETAGKGKLSASTNNE